MQHLCLHTINAEILIAAALEGDEVTTLEMVFSRDAADEKTEIHADRGLAGLCGKQKSAKAVYQFDTLEKPYLGIIF